VHIRSVVGRQHLRATTSVSFSTNARACIGAAALHNQIMPKEIVTRTGASFYYRDYEPAPPDATGVRVRVTFAAPKHGTEVHSISGSAHDVKTWDPELRMFLPRPKSTDATPLADTEPRERGIGNMIVGTVEACGSAVTRWTPGDRVFAYGPIRQIHQADQDALYPLGDLAEVDAVAIDPAHVAFVAVRDGNIRIGDTVAVYGLGAIGLMAVQIARAGGARRVFAVDPIAIRRDYAKAHGADDAFDPTQVDAALQIKLATGKKGADVSIETSGNSRALHDAIRCIQKCGTIVHVPWGPKDAAHLHLDEEFHINRPTMIASQAWAGWGCPDRDYPLWDHARTYAATIELMRAGLITGQGLIHPIVSFDHAPAALTSIFTQPQTTIKVGVRVA
jgi:threonine dehydrogenase-like Zn-dependent dehydrogenase